MQYENSPWDAIPPEGKSVGGAPDRLSILEVVRKRVRGMLGARSVRATIQDSEDPLTVDEAVTRFRRRNKELQAKKPQFASEPPDGASAAEREKYEREKLYWERIRGEAPGADETQDTIV